MAFDGNELGESRRVTWAGWGFDTAGKFHALVELKSVEKGHGDRDVVSRDLEIPHELEQEGRALPQNCVH